ncbi:MAG: hypothetical protein H6Q65_729 [Firmicutes bacterium]|nr:hypothetical protein [Bacillota bacterium]
MSTIILACQTIRNEVRKAIEETGVPYPVFYLEAGLHNKPERLHARVMEEIAMLDNVGTILMAFGFCGNSMLGLRADQAKIVIPKTEDCIPLLLGSSAARLALSREMGTYFLTKGWLDYEQNIIWEYERCLKRYGEQRAVRVMKTMLGHYKRFLLIDTGAYPVDSILPRTLAFAERMAMKHEIRRGSLQILHKLFLGQWDENFLVLKPGEELTLDQVLGSLGDSQAVSQISCSQNRMGER